MRRPRPVPVLLGLLALVLVGLAITRVGAEDSSPTPRFDPITVTRTPDSTSTPTPTPSLTPPTDPTRDDDYRKVNPVPRDIDDDDDWDDDDDEDDRDDDD